MSARQNTFAEDLRAMHALLAARDPELLDAVSEVDRSLIRVWLMRDPWERARMSYETAAGIAELRTWRRTD